MPEHSLAVIDTCSGPPSGVSPAEIERELGALIEGDVRFGLHDRMLYATDASIYQVPPIGVVIPGSIDEANAVISYCADRNLPILPRGGGTALAGQTVNVRQAPFLTVPFEVEDPGNPGTMLNLWTTPVDKFGADNIITEYPDSSHWGYDTITFGVEKRFTQSFFVNASFDYQWRDEGRRANSITTSPLSSDPINTGWYQNHSRDVDTLQKSTNWGFKALARYVFPHEIGVATNMRLQSGYPYARRVDMRIYAGTGVDGPNAGPSLGTQRFFVEDMNNNRSDSVPIWDFRIDKAFPVSNAGQFMIMVDIFNILNSNAVTAAQRLNKRHTER